MPKIAVYAGVEYMCAAAGLLAGVFEMPRLGGVLRGCGRICEQGHPPRLWRTMQTQPPRHPLTPTAPNSGRRMLPGFSFAPSGKHRCTERTMKRPAHARDCARRGAIPGRFAATARPVPPNRPPPKEAAWWGGGAAISVWRIDITYWHIIRLR